MTMTRTTRSFLVAVVGGLALAACGESEIGGAQAAFITEVDARCAEVMAELADLPAPDTSAEVAAAYVAQMGEFRDEMRGRSAPREESAVWQRYLANVDNTYHSLQALEVAVAAADDARIERRLADVRLSSQQGAEVAQGYGLRVCSQLEL